VLYVGANRAESGGESSREAFVKFQVDSGWLASLL
jgi:hypothetical protein